MYTTLLSCTPLACATRMPPSLVAEVQALREGGGFLLVDSAVDRLDNDEEASREVALDSGGTYVLLAECTCQGMSVKVVPSSFLQKVLPHHLIVDDLDEVYKERAPRLRFVAAQTGRHLVRLRMSECKQWTFRDGEWGHRAAACEYGFYLLKESISSERAPPP